MRLMPRRTPETLADYLVVAICPTLIALLVGSLMWFLVEVFYQGEFKGRLIFVMAMFVMGIELALEYCQAHPELGAVLIGPGSKMGAVDIRTVGLDNADWKLLG